MGPAMLLSYETELAYRRERIADDWARSRPRPRTSRDGTPRRAAVGRGWRPLRSLRT